jgi:hypothetical protein
MWFLCVNYVYCRRSDNEICCFNASSFSPVPTPPKGKCSRFEDSIKVSSISIFSLTQILHTACFQWQINWRMHTDATMKYVLAFSVKTAPGLLRSQWRESLLYLF